MSNRLGTLVKREMARQRLSSSQVAARSEGEFSAGWIRQLTGGRIDRPGRAKLAALSSVLGVELADLLALSDQLGAVAELRQAYAGTAPPEWATRLEEMLRAIALGLGINLEEQMELLRDAEHEAGEGPPSPGRDDATEHPALRAGNGR